MPRKMIYVKDQQLIDWTELFCLNHGVSFSALIQHLLEQHRIDRKFTTLPDGDHTPGFLKRKLDI